MRRFILSVGKTAHQTWHDHPFSQRNRTTETTVRVGSGDNRENEGEWTKIEEEEIDNMRWDFIK